MIAVRRPDPTVVLLWVFIYTWVTALTYYIFLVPRGWPWPA
jgi:hypothetical protein